MSTTYRSQVIVVGAGLCGLATAAGLREFCDVTILESSPAIRELGAAIIVQPGGMKIMEDLGIDLLDNRGTESKGVREFDGQSKKINFDLTQDYRAQFGRPAVTMHRVELQKALLHQAIREDGPSNPCVLHLNARVASVDCEATTVTMVDGKVYTGDIIIGADGFKSITRDAVLDTHFPLQPSGWSCFRTLIPVSAFIDDQELKDLQININKITSIHAVNKRVACYLCQSGQVMNLAGIVPDTSLKVPATPSWTDVTSPTALVEAYSDFAPHWQRLLALGTQPGLWQLCDIKQIPTWVKGNTILLGDAAHAMTPFLAQAASQAFEDAEATVFCLKSVTKPEEISSALKRIERIRYKRAHAIQTKAREIGTIGEEKLGKPDLIKFRRWGWDYHGAEDWEKNQPEWLL